MSSSSLPFSGIPIPIATRAVRCCNRGRLEPGQKGKGTEALRKTEALPVGAPTKSGRSSDEHGSAISAASASSTPFLCITVLWIKGNLYTTILWRCSWKSHARLRPKICIIICVINVIIIICVPPSSHKR